MYPVELYTRARRAVMVEGMSHRKAYRSRDIRGRGPCCRELRAPVRLPFDQRSSDES